MAGDTGWSNWAGNQSADGITVTRPRGADEIARAIADARRSGRRIRPIGSGHSFTGIGRPDTGVGRPGPDHGRPGPVQLRLDRHADLVHFDAATRKTKGPWRDDHLRTTDDQQAIIANEDGNHATALGRV